MGKGVLDDTLRMSDLLRSDVDYTRPPGGGEDLFDLVGDLRGKRLLDVGCGLGRFRSVIEGKGATWVGVDLTGDTCSVNADAYRLPFPDESVDGVLSSAVLEHMPEPVRAVRELHRVIRPGGLLFGYVAFLEPLHGMSYFHMSHMGLEYLLLSNGFRPERIYPSHVAPSYQLEQVLFTKPVPGVQPLARATLRGSMHVVMAGNRLGREILMWMRRTPGPQREIERKQYRQLLALRHAIGFNFVARRESEQADLVSGYRSLKTEG